jgi:hypothetical protein
MLLLSLLIFVLSACQQPETKPVDLEAEELAINELLDKVFLSFETQDVATLSSIIADDVLVCGSDPSEFYDKQQITEIWTQMLAESSYEFNTISERNIRIAPDGYSASAIEQFFMPIFSTVLPFRISYHLIKLNEEWKIFCWNGACIPKNEDLPKINEALSE